MSIFRKKTFNSLLLDSTTVENGGHVFKKTLGYWQLIALGLGAVIGAGLFTVTGFAAGNYAGPAVLISFLIAAIGCCFVGFCYAEFASILPIAGSAYSYSYATLGEFVAWIIGWNLILEYAVGALMVSLSWTRYLVKFFEHLSIYIPIEFTNGPWEGGILNLPAAFIVIVMSLLLIRGTEGSSRINALIVCLKIGIIVSFIVLGWKFIDFKNYVPFVPENTGKWGEFGFSGIIRAAAIIFFAYVGFDSVSTAAQETKNPQQYMPIGILGTLIVCTILYILFTFVMIGVAQYINFKGQAGIAPVVVAIDHMGTFRWLSYSIVPIILVGFSSVILVMLLAQSRIFYAMSKDGLIPKSFSKIHKNYATPYKSNLLLMVVVSIAALFVPANVAGELASIGTLVVFIIVSVGVLVMRKTMPNISRTFRTPCVPFIPVIGIFICFFMMIFLPFGTWIRFIFWILVGHDIYMFYGYKHSKLRINELGKGYKTLSLIGIGLSSTVFFVLMIFHYCCDQSEKWISVGSKFFIFLWIISILHISLYGYCFIKNYKTE